MEYNLETVTKSFEKYKNLRFPLKIWILVNAGGNRFIQWDSSQTVVVVDRDALERYLQSAGSIFCCTKLATFFWLMDFNGFEAVLDDPIVVDDELDDNKHVLQYRHSSFTRENRAYFEQLLRSRQLREVVSQQNGNCSVHRGRILKNQKQEGDASKAASTTRGLQSLLSSSSFAEEKAQLLAETDSLKQSIREAYGSLSIGEDGVIPIIEVPDTYCDEPTAGSVPEYTTQRSIAGNYGHAKLDDLKRFFGNYLPVYDDSPDIATSDKEEEQPSKEPEEINQRKSPPPSPMSSPKPVEPEPKPVGNTLGTFDYKDQDVEMESFASTDYGELLPLETHHSIALGFPKDEDENQGPSSSSSLSAALAATEVADSKNNQLDDAEFQLYSDIRETFELLNGF